MYQKKDFFVREVSFTLQYCCPLQVGSYIKRHESTKDSERPLEIKFKKKTLK